MSATKSNIEWTDTTWNPTTGCTKVSQGCKHCYAETLTQRYAGRPGWPAEFKPWTPANAAENVVLHPDRLEAPFSWRTPRRVFVNSMSDLFHENVPASFVDEVFRVMWMTPQHQYQVLTKRPDRMRQYLTTYPSRASEPRPYDEAFTRDTWGSQSPLPNVWLGVTVENQRWADKRIPILLDTPAAVRFVSAEPLLGDLALHPWLFETPGIGIDWLIIGGESGPRHRPFDIAWAQSLLVQTKGTACHPFVKQLGGARPGNRLEDLPPDLRVREFPA